MMKESEIKADMFTKEEENHVKVLKNFRSKDGTIWYLNQDSTSKWPNGNPHRALYESLWGGKLVVWLNELGGMIYAQYA